MKIIVSKNILDKFPETIIGVIIVKGLNNEKHNEEITKLLREVEEKTRNENANLESTSSHPNIISWRQAYKEFGADPHAYRCSSEALLKRVVKRQELWQINKLVDLYNYISLKYMTPVGGEDLDKVQGDIYLDFAKGDEQFIRLGGEENEPPLSGEVVYKDDVGVMCRRWNWREADRTKLSEETKNSILVIEGLSPMTLEKVEEATKELEELVKKFCGGQTAYKILHKEDAELSF